VKRLNPKTTLLVVVDIQDKLARAMPEAQLRKVTWNAAILLDAAKRLGVRTIASEQYPQGLGPTVAEVAAALTAHGIAPMPKIHFDALGDDAIHKKAFQGPRPEAAVIIGMETHVCVFQTARSFVERGVPSYVVSDAVASRSEENRQNGLHLVERAGAVVTNTESVVFDWLERASSEDFKALSKLIR
jgi:nicotinamidase-related amidase